MKKAFLRSILVLSALLTLAIVPLPARAARLELNEDESSFSVSCSLFAHAGRDSDSETYQDSSLDSTGHIGMTIYAVDPGTSAHMGFAMRWMTVSGDYLSSHWLTWAMDGDAFINEDDAFSVGFSATMNAEVNLVWEIIPTSEYEDANIPVFLYCPDSGAQHTSGPDIVTNATYEMGIYDYTFGPETEIYGPYSMESHCCPAGQESTFPEEGDLWLVAHFGDSVRFSYKTSASAGTNDPTADSKLYRADVSISHVVGVLPLAVWFRDTEDCEIVEAACCDGESRVSIFLGGLPDELFPDDEYPTCIRLTVLSDGGKDNGHLIEEGEDDDGDYYDDTPRIEYGCFTQTWCAPDVFDSVEGAANTAKSREITIQFEMDTDNDGTYDTTFKKHIELIRPPVVMVHGLWSSGSTFAALARRLEQKGWRTELLSRPSYDNKASLEHNEGVVPEYVNQVLTHAHDMKYACSKVDIVAHSMGGLLSKLIPYDVAQEKVRKIITVGTPYEGSPWADLLWAVRGTPLGNNLDKLICASPLRVNPPAITGGAIEDLRTDPGNAALPVSTQIPGVDCSTVVVGEGFYAGLPRWYRYFLCLLSGKSVWTAEIIHTAIFGPGAESDWIVSEASQRYDAPSPSYIPVVWHCSETGDADFVDIVVRSLNQPAEMLSTTLPTGPVGGTTVINRNSRESQTAAATVGLYAESKFSGTVEILLPREGQTITAGEHVTISVRGTGDANEAVVFAFFGTESYADLVHLPWR